MRRTALLVSAALLTGLLPLASAGAATGAEEPPPVPVDRFEGEVPFASQPAEGIFTWGGDSDDPPKLELAARDDAPEGDKVLSGTYDISGYGGFTHDFAANEPGHDWSAHKGIRFWWDGKNAGKRINFEIKDGGANGEASELWTTSFTDDWTGWHQVEIPFTDFAYRTDYQPVGGIDQILGLDRDVGLRAHPARPARPAPFAMDGVELYGKADPALTTKVLTGAAVYPVKEGGTAGVRISVATTGSAPLDEPVTVAYESAGGSAGAGTDYTPVKGEFTFPAGTASGATHTVSVPTLKDKAAEPAETIPLKLTVTGAKAPAETPQVVIDAHGLPVPRRQAPGEAARRRPALPDVPGGEGRPDDAGRAQRGRHGRRHRRLRPRLAALRRRLDADAEHGRGLGEDDRRLPAPGAGDAVPDPADLRRGRGARPQQPRRRHGPAAQHRHRRDPRPRDRPRRRARSRPPRSAPPASPGTSRPACASPATNAGAGPTSPSARTPRS